MDRQGRHVDPHRRSYWKTILTAACATIAVAGIGAVVLARGTSLAATLIGVMALLAALALAAIGVAGVVVLRVDMRWRRSLCRHTAAPIGEAASTTEPHGQ